MRQNAANQKEWADQQKRESAAQKAREEHEEQEYAAQTNAITRMRGMLEDEMNSKRAQMMKEMQDYNKQLALQKRQREDAWKNDQESQNQAETTLTNHHEQLSLDGKIKRMQ